MAGDALLSDLCSICNTAKFKYRCPGCSARTCSLPCYKRHQQWAQCSGKRDPTKFVKKSQLATPAGIDHDYNFLTNIDRGLEKAEKTAEDRGGLGNPPDPRHNAQRRQPTDQHFAAAGVTVIRAPKGLSRQKENKTRFTKNKNLIWTIEWVHEDTTRILTETPSTAPILQEQPFDKVSKKDRKRKRGADQPTSEISQDVSSSIKTEEGEPAIKTEHTEPNPPTGGLEPERDDPSATAGDDTSRGAPATEGHEVKTASDHYGSLRIHGSESEPVPPQYAFYLLRPRTSSNRLVLIRVEPTATLAECLRGRTVLEFPTIYVFPITANPPPEKFLLEAEYLQQEGEEQKEFEDLIKHVSPETLRALKEEHGDNRNSGEEIDSDRILDVLKQDLGTGA